MKQKTITTDKATILVVECPKTYSLFHDDGWELIERIPHITEDQAGKIVDEDNDYGTTLYQNYTTTSMRYFDEQISAIESLYSLLQANEIYFENPVKLPDYDMKYMTSRWTYYGADILKHREAQSKVWDKERTYLFIKGD